MSNKLTVEQYEAIRSLTALGWGIRRIARELKVSRNTVRNHVRPIGPPDAKGATGEVLTPPLLSPPGLSVRTDPLSTPGPAPGIKPSDPPPIAGNTGRKSLCVDHAALILTNVEAHLTAQ